MLTLSGGVVTLQASLIWCVLSLSVGVPFLSWRSVSNVLFSAGVGKFVFCLESLGHVDMFFFVSSCEEVRVVSDRVVVFPSFVS